MSGKKDAIGDFNKPRLSLIPREALWELGKALTYGEEHYGTHNWRDGIKVSYLTDAAMRHIIRFLDGEDIDENGAHHLGCAMASLSMAISTTINNPKYDDRFKGEDSEKRNESNIKFDSKVSNKVDEKRNSVSDMSSTQTCKGGPSSSGIRDL
jgi:hypothetical protein